MLVIVNGVVVLGRVFTGIPVKDKFEVVKSSHSLLSLENAQILVYDDRLFLIPLKSCLIFFSEQI